MKTVNNNPFDIAEELGIEVMEAEFVHDSILGFIEKVHGKTTIYIRMTDTAHKKRFTLAHEIGHYLLHLRDIDNTSFLDGIEIFTGQFDNYVDRKQETEANQFAYDLLMPETKVKDAWLDCLYSPLLMAAHFQVPLEVMNVRLYQLKLICGLA